MIKAQELRMGNWVLDNGTEQEIEATGIEWAAYNGEFGFEPIILTEDWLIKFGFEKLIYNSPIAFADKKIKDLHIQKINDCFIFDGWRAFPIKCVHQLQNLYFALTGEELIIK